MGGLALNMSVTYEVLILAATITSTDPRGEGNKHKHGIRDTRLWMFPCFSVP